MNMARTAECLPLRLCALGNDNHTTNDRDEYNHNKDNTKNKVITVTMLITIITIIMKKNKNAGTTKMMTSRMV